MSERSITPDFTAVQIPWDMWSEPFWQATAEHRLMMPRCTDCKTFRWPAGPFCYKCRSQNVEWMPTGQPRLFSYTIIPVPAEQEGAPLRHRVPIVVEFDDAKGVRLVSLLVDTPLDRITIGDPIAVDWLPAANAETPVFRLTA